MRGTMRDRRLGCRRLRHEILMYAEGGLDRPGSEAVRAHLETCDACREMAGHLRSITLSVKALRDEAAMAPDAAWLARVARQKAAGGRGVRGLAMKLNSWVDDVVGPVIDRPMEALVASGLVLWLAALNVTGILGLERLVTKLAAAMIFRVAILRI